LEGIVGKGSTVDIPIIVELSKAAIPKEELFSLFDIFSRLEARLA
jgi:hypothetical protein